MIVSNTTPITNLARLGLLPVLGHLVGDLVVPPEVLAELEAGHGPADVWLPSKDVLAVEVKAAAPSALFVELRLRLDAGEAAAICLALDVGASCVLMDEVEGRLAARRHGLKVVGTLALLVEMKARGLLDDLEAQLERLRHELHFWFSDELRDWALGKTTKS